MVRQEWMTAGRVGESTVERRRWMASGTELIHDDASWPLLLMTPSRPPDRVIDEPPDRRNAGPVVSRPLPGDGSARATKLDLGRTVGAVSPEERSSGTLSMSERSPEAGGGRFLGADKFLFEADPRQSAGRSGRRFIDMPLRKMSCMNVATCSSAWGHLVLLR